MPDEGGGSVIRVSKYLESNDVITKSNEMWTQSFIFMLSLKNVCCDKGSIM